jgi:tight adherence protein B
MSDSLLMILAGVFGLLAVGGVAFAFAAPGGSSGRVAKRTQAIAERSRASARARAAAPDPTARRKQILKTLRDQERRQRKASFNLAARLQQAGLPISQRTFWIISAVLGVVVFLAATAFGQKLFIGLALGMAAALGLPRWVIGFLAKRRAKKFVEAFADASDIIVRGIRTGLPVHECLHIIGKESPEPLGGEFRRLMDGVSHGMTMDQALDKMYERMPIPELRFFTIVLGIQQKTGGNLAEALGNLSSVLRARKLMREKIKALSSEATASAMIIGAMPPGVITLISMTTPSYLAILFQETRGQILLGGAALWMATGIFVMNRMINFKF